MADDTFLDGFASDMIENDAGAAPEPRVAETPPTPPITPPEKAPEAPAEKPGDKPQEQPRAQDGRFATKEATPAAADPAQAAPAAKPLVDPEQFKGYLDERDKRQKLEKELADDRAELARLRAAQQTPVKAPSFQEDQEGYIAHQQSEMRKAVIVERFNTSRMFAAQKYSEDEIKAAEEWGNSQLTTQPGFVQKQLAQAHPVDWLVKQHKRDQLINSIGDDPDAWAAARVAEKAAAQPPQAPAPAGTPQPAPSTPPAPAPTRSLAHATAAGANASVATGEHVPFDALFKK